MFLDERCDGCGECLVFCPYNQYGEDRAREEIAALRAGETPPIVGSCITCAACNQICPTGANPFDLINERQEESGALGVPDEALERFANLHELPTQVRPGDPGKPVVNLCIVGAMVREQLEGSLFDGLTVVEGADYFCGVGYIHLGKPSLVEKQAGPFIRKLSELRADEVVCFHDDCYTLLTSLAEQYRLEVPFRPVHLFEYLRRSLKERSGELRPLGLRIAYQAPCASRYTPEKDRYLGEIFELVGAERVERRHEGIEGLCCGAPLMATDRERALEVKTRNVSDAKDHGADAMVFLCPMCFLNLRKLCRENGIEPVFVTELCNRALGRA